MRKYFLDNLRWMVIIIVVLYHVLIIYNDIGVQYVINATGNVLATVFILSFSMWFMQLLFAVAGISTFYSLKRRNSKQYLNERVKKIFIPMVAGIIFVIPFQTYFSFLYNGQNISFLNFWFNFLTNWWYYFVNGLGIGPLWFLLYLFIISLAALPVIMKYKKSEWRIPIEKITVPYLLLLIIPLAIGSIFLNLSPEKSVVQFFLLFIFGYFLLSDDGIQQKLEDARWPLFIAFLLLIAVLIILYLSNLLSSKTMLSTMIPVYLLYTTSIAWIGILAVMGMGKRYLEFKTPATLYLSGASYPIYIFHIAWITMAEYLFLTLFPNMIILQVILVFTVGFTLTLATYEITRRIKITRFLFGIKD
ncbi:MAG: acyltransferase family protein [Methanobacterium sp.]|uniref:acyltransferase family protein n=1 Tax=Methanobacterium sp. TaxID=2164 RepID=UPI003D662589|nr:acyltransferase family protein [Methanobacterium sp.]